MSKILGTFLALAMALVMIPARAQTQALTTTLTWSCSSATNGANTAYTCIAGGAAGQFQVQWPTASNLSVNANGNVISLSSTNQTSGFNCTAGTSNTATTISVTCTGTLPSSLTYQWTLQAGKATPQTSTTNTNSLPIVQDQVQSTTITYSVKVCDATNANNCAIPVNVSAPTNISPPAGCTISTTTTMPVNPGSNVNLSLGTTCTNLGSNASYTWTPAPQQSSGATATVAPQSTTDYTVKVCNVATDQNTCMTTPPFKVTIGSSSSGALAQCGPGFIVENLPWVIPNTVDSLRKVNVSSNSGIVYIVDVPPTGRDIWWGQPWGTAGTVDIAFSPSQACVFGNTNVSYVNTLPVGNTAIFYVIPSPVQPPYNGAAKLSPGRWYITVRGRTTSGGEAQFEMYTE